MPTTLSPSDLGFNLETQLEIKVKLVCVAFSVGSGLHVSTTQLAKGFYRRVVVAVPDQIPAAATQVKENQDTSQEGQGT